LRLLVERLVAAVADALDPSSLAHAGEVDADVLELGLAGEAELLRDVARREVAVAVAAQNPEDLVCEAGVGGRGHLASGGGGNARDAGVDLFLDASALRVEVGELLTEFLELFAVLDEIIDGIAHEMHNTRT